MADHNFAEVEQAVHRWLDGHVGGTRVAFLLDELKPLWAMPVDPLAEALESERLGAELGRCVREANGKIASFANRAGVSPDYVRLVSSPALSGADGPIDPSPLRRLLAALSRLDSTASGDGSSFNAALDEVLGAGREVRASLGGEEPK